MSLSAFAAEKDSFNRKMISHEDTKTRSQEYEIKVINYFFYYSKKKICYSGIKLIAVPPPGASFKINVSDPVTDLFSIL